MPRLYESLAHQTSNDFIWHIVDDGSTDNTEELIDKFKNGNKIKIYYTKKKNGGKQRAHNDCIAQCKSELFLCVDSDDYLISTAVADLLNKWDKIKQDPKLAGLVFLKGYSTNKALGTCLPENVGRVTLSDLYQKYRFSGDAGLMFRTTILRQYPFYVAPGEKFIGEKYIYDQIDQKYFMETLNKILYIAEYLPDGYSKNMRKIIKENPIGYLTLKKQSIRFSQNLIEKFKDTILYIDGCLLANKKELIFEAPSKMLVFLGYIPALLIKRVYFK